MISMPYVPYLRCLETTMHSYVKLVAACDCWAGIYWALKNSRTTNTIAEEKGLQSDASSFKVLVQCSCSGMLRSTV